ncbi:MAG: hypothetical protein IJ268_04505 [Proteobacteria bacterium]|nr:hypothetical protein [Pseudomonadota bacterium]
MHSRMLKSAIAIALFLNIQTAYAQDVCPVDRNDSVYCDDSWQGSLEFLAFLSARKHLIKYGDDLQGGLADAERVVQIWRDPPASLDAEAVRDMLDKGARILVFDESDVSLGWFRSFRNQAAISSEAPPTPYASHINGNQALPVFEQVGELLNFKPPSAKKLQVAFNHASPLSTLDSHGGVLMMHTFSEPADLNGLKAGQGALFVVRDESFPTRLMLHTLDNDEFLGLVLDALCADRKPCPVALFEPKFGYVPASEGDAAEDSFGAEMQKFFEQTKERIADRWEAGKKQRENMPWAFVILACLMVWSLCTFLYGVPTGRVKE